jgi:hypothetical protein
VEGKRPLGSAVRFVSFLSILHVHSVKNCRRLIYCHDREIFAHVIFGYVPLLIFGVGLDT